MGERARAPVSMGTWNFRTPASSTSFAMVAKA